MKKIKFLYVKNYEDIFFFFHRKTYSFINEFTEYIYKISYYLDKINSVSENYAVTYYLFNKDEGIYC
jgi:hypothetical protein